MITRRSQEPLTPQKLIDEVAFAALDWPGKTVRLERDTLQDYCQRPASAQPSIAELYHTNSGLFPQKAGELAAAHVDVDGVRREFLRRRAGALAASPPAELSGDLRRLLTSLAQAVPAEWFYAVEVRVIEGGAVAMHEPLADRVLLIKQLSASDSEALAAAWRLLAPSPGPLPAMLVGLGNFARYDLLYGARGYRRALLEAGGVLNATLGLAGRLGWAARPRLEFADQALNTLLEADGVEEGVLFGVELEERNDHG